MLSETASKHYDEIEQLTVRSIQHELYDHGHHRKEILR